MTKCLRILACKITNIVLLKSNNPPIIATRHAQTFTDECQVFMHLNLVYLFQFNFHLAPI